MIFKLILQYLDVQVFIHEASGLPGGDLPDPPDPQVLQRIIDNLLDDDHYKDTILDTKP